jgi:ribosomal protein L29
MANERLKNSEAKLRRLVELRLQRKVIARWLTGAGTPTQSQTQLEEMFAQVKAELEELEGTPASGERDAIAEQAD